MTQKSIRNPEPFVSIIIPTRNRPDRLQQCLTSLAKLDYSKTRFEVIVVDDGSSAQLCPTIGLFADKINLHLIRQENRGPATARNRGVKHAKGEYIIFTDDDCQPAPGWLVVLIDFLAKKPESMVGGKTLNGLPKNLFSTTSQALISYLYSYYNKNPDQAQFFTSNNLALSKKGFLVAGGFDYKWGRAAAEDREFCDRWLLNGYEMIYASEARIYHTHEMNLSEFLVQHFNYGHGAYYFHRARDLRNQDRMKIEPLSFYFNLLCFPFLKFKKLKAALVSGLFVLAQAANSAGFFCEWFRQKAVKGRLNRTVPLSAEIQNEHDIKTQEEK